MIASGRNALHVGTAKLVVDGTDTTLMRKATIAVLPTRVQARALSALLGWSRDVYNGALQHRRDAWRMGRVPIRRFDQFGEIPTLREDHPEVARFGIQPIRGAISRVDEAFAAFFRRVSDGDKPGYPRFKSARRLASAFYDEPVSWALSGLDTSAGTDRGRVQRPVLYVQGIGDLALSKRATAQLRRLIDRGGEARTLTITQTRSGAWRAVIGFRAVSVKILPENHQIGGIDRGITATAALPDGTLVRCPPFVRTSSAAIAELSRRRAGHPKNSPAYKKLNRAIAKEYRRARARAENWARHLALEIVARYEVIALEDLKLVNMTRSARGTAERPGKGVAAKSGLNRSLQEAALGRLGHWICVKAEEAGRRVYLVDAKNSSRCCAACGHTEAANRQRSRFACLRCGHAEHADVNAAQVITARGATAEALWRAQGSRPLTRPVPRMRRQKAVGPRAAARPPRATKTDMGPGRLLTQSDRAERAI